MLCQVQTQSYMLTILVRDKNINRVMSDCVEAQSRAEVWFSSNHLKLNESKTVKHAILD